MKRIILLLLSIFLMLSLCACHDYTEEVFEYAMIAESGDLQQLDTYPNLKYVDLRGSTCYSEIMEYTEAHPDVTVRYNVELGNKRFAQDSTEIALNPDDFQFNLLLDNLQYLPALNELTFVHTDLTADQIHKLQDTYPDLSIHYDVLYRQEELSDSLTKLDFSALSSDEIAEATTILSLLPNLTDVNLMDEDGTSGLTLADVKILTEAFPKINFHYDFMLFGQKVSTMDQELVFDEVEIGNEGITQIREALDIMKQCTYVKLDSCKIDDTVMAQLRDDYTDKEIVWRVFVNRYSMLTDEEMLRMPSRLSDTNTEPLKYCTKVKYLDINSGKLSDISFISYMPELECAILTLTKVNDLTPLTNCPNLTWLELSNCGRLTSIACLSQLTNLKYLNISQTKLSDISALENLPLERFVCTKSKVEDTDLEHFVANHPDCLTVSTGSNLGYGWRYDDNAQTPFSYYSKLEEIFRYKERGYTGNRKEN